MRSFLILSTCLVSNLWIASPATSQRMLSIRADKPVICYQSFEDRPDHVGLSERLKELRQRGVGRTKAATIEVEYDQFPVEARNAFQFAVEIWESELVSSVPIRIRARWTPLTSGVLGQAIWGSAHANFGREQHLNTFYPVALAEKIAGHDINPVTEPDIEASFNSSSSWYFGTDGKTPSGKMDMVTIVLHEIAHGLGFTDTYDVEGTQGSVGISSGGVDVPFIFDVFVENNGNKNLLKDFQSPSTALATELQSSNVFFDSPLALNALNGNRPKLYAPSAFDNGSSISHLDEASFNSQQDANRLMTPQIAFAESIHTPGNLLLAMLADMGWINTAIDHTPLKDTERQDGQPYVITTRIISDNGYDPATVKLNYSSDGVNFTSSAMTPTGSADEFEFSLPGTTGDRAYVYFISVNDIDNRTFTNPGKIQEIGKVPEQGTHYFRIGPDSESPEILHEPVDFLEENANELIVTAEVTDNLGVKEVLVEYRVNEGSLQTVVMPKSAEPNVFRVTIDLPTVDHADEIQYRIVARDQAVAENISMDPENGFHVVNVAGIMPAQDSYSNNFDSPSSDFFGHSFSITTPAGFNNGAIHSDHPYENGMGPGNESNYTYQLQIPIRLGDSNPTIKFEEIVLVEPGEDQSVFGDPNFFDYVIVEGSDDRGQTWKPFAPGYDSRGHSVWLTRYNSKISNDNSEGTGDPALFVQRTINMLENGNFSEGDEVLIRFRLFVDQFAHGWGWAIDNLLIQAPVTGVEPPLEKVLHVYPVPAQDQLFIDLMDRGNDPVDFVVSDASGKVILGESIPDRSGPVHRAIDLHFFREGSYILRVKCGERYCTRKFLKVAR